MVDCEHDFTFISSSHGVGEGMFSHEVRICKNCGQFYVWTQKEGQTVHFTFRLMIPEHVVAAGQYIEYLKSVGVEFPTSTD